MAKKIVIAELEINVDSLVQSTAEVKASIDALKKQQTELVKSGQGASEQYVKNVADLKVLNSAYNANIKMMVDSTNAQSEQITRTQMLDLALQMEVKSIDDAREANKALTKLRNEANATTTEGQAEILKLNNALDANNDFIKDNADAYLQQKINIGNYSDSIKDALQNLNPMNGGLSGFIQRSQEAGGVGNLLKTSLAGVGQGIIGVTKASLAFIMTPIGLVVTAIGAALGLLYNYLTSTKSGIDAVTAVTRPLQAVFTSLMQVVGVLGKNLFEAFSNPKKVMTDLYEFVKGNLINRFTAFGVILDGIMSLDFKKVANGAIQAGTGVENMTDKLQAGAKATNGFLSDAIKKGHEIDRLKKDIELSELSYQRAQIKTNDLIDEQLLISKDTSKTFAERAIASNEIIKLTKELSVQEEEIIQKKIQSLKLEQALKGVKELTVADQQAMIDLEVQLDEAQDRGLNAQLEQTKVLSGLKKEQADQAKQQHDEAVARQKELVDNNLKQLHDEIDLMIQQQGVKKKTLAEEVAFEKSLVEEKTAVLDAELKAKKISQTQYETSIFELKNGYSQKVAEMLGEDAKRELYIFTETNKSKIDANTVYTQAVVDAENERLNLLSEAQAKNATAQLQQGLINATEYNDAIKVIDEEYRLAKLENDTNFENAIKEQKLAQLQADREIELANATTKFEEDSIIAQQNFDAEKLMLDEQKAKLLLTEEQYNAKLIDADKKKREALRLAELNSTAEKLQGYQKLGQGLEQLFGKNKLISSAMAGINTALAVTEIMKEPAPELISGGIMRAIQIATTIATGAKSIAEINGMTFAGGGFIEAKGKSHAEGGIPISIGGQSFGTMQGGEGLAIMNKGAYSQFKAFNNTYGDSDVSRNGYFAGGGLITQTVPSQTMDFSSLSNEILQGIRQLPSPIVTVEDINYGQQSRAEVVSGANF